MVLKEAERREIGQHFVFGFEGHEISDDIKTLIQQYFIGSVILFKRNVKDPKQVFRIVREMQVLAHDAGHRTPLLIGIDEENGIVSRLANSEAGTQLPGSMALAAANSLPLVEQVYRGSGRELKFVGINWAYSPVADVNSDSRNPVIGVRSFGDDPHSVAAHTVSALRGHLSASIASTAKHFPGHGDTHVDSHLALPVVHKSKAELYSTELIPFQALIERGIPSIMTSHVALPSLTPDTPDIPASLSREITTELLKTELGYKGVVVTDCLEMEAVASGKWKRSSDDGGKQKDGSILGGVAALQAGADIVMICHTMARQRGAVELVYASIEDGTLSFADIEQSGKRIASLKEKFTGSWDSVLVSLPSEAEFEKQWADVRADNLRLSRDAYDKTVALVKNSDAIPLRKGKLALYTPRPENINKAVDDSENVLRTANGKLRNTAGPSYLAFAASVRKRVAACNHVVYAPDSPSEELALEAGVEGVIFTLRNAEQADWQITQLKKVLHEAKKADDVPVTILASCAPYDLMGVQGIFEQDRKIAYVASFEFTPQALEAATKVIFGEIQAVGRVPVCGGAIL